ncbi:2Fe-2S iron-sulfur cluster-binding protein [Halioxenophilus sp. WMMB6]|uniref:2Fe-2S iron-sulfur cluster-binding protein n=1 Tax=Halioxenophilus sp. WMMB6 TaxID=3073815 RepID=UPI00295E6AE7|nr:2Fe-2S iron-sulfur cluster-binding protein [Halioxenophilus sp. WMMB6]
MFEISITDRAGATSTIIYEPGMTLMQAITEAGVDELLALCGGVCSCGTCHVYIDKEQQGLLPAISIDEEALLAASSHRRTASRLSCQLPLTDKHNGLTLVIAPEE